MNEQEIGSIWQVRFDLALALTLLIIAKTGRSGEPHPDVLFYLEDRYGCFAEEHRKPGAIKKAQRLQAKAEDYLRASGWWNDPPPAVAMAMPVPRRPTFTEAIGRHIRNIPPDDAA